MQLKILGAIAAITHPLLRNGIRYTYFLLKEGGILATPKDLLWLDRLYCQYHADLYYHGDDFQWFFCLFALYHQPERIHLLTGIFFGHIALSDSLYFHADDRFLL